MNLQHNNLLIRDITLTSRDRLKEVSAGSVDSGFIAWVHADSKDIFVPELPSEFAVSNYSHVAQLGFLTALYPKEYESKNDLLIEGLTRTSGRPATIAGVGTAPFCSDAIALLGIAIGANLVGGDTLTAIQSWFNSILEKPLHNLPEWKKIVINAAVTVLRQGAAVPYKHGRVYDLELALTAKGLKDYSDQDFDMAYKAICEGSIVDEPELALIGVRLASIHYLINHLPAISISKPKISEISQVLSNLNSGFRRWPWEEKAKTSTSSTQKWDIQNEYHVQSLLYFLLAPLFPDIESEFYLENTGQLNSRADIGLPSINLIIEVKFLRPNVSFQKILEEIAADATLYFKKDSVYKDKYSSMLVFVWDDSNRNQEYSVFKSGIKGMSNIVDAVVIPRPGNMVKSSPKG